MKSSELFLSPSITLRDHQSWVNLVFVSLAVEVHCRHGQPLVIAMVAIGLLAFFNPSAPPIRPSRPRKTRRPFFKPKNAVLTTSVEPAEARPGDTVTFKVTAKLDPGFHIYKYSKIKARAGPGQYDLRLLRSRRASRSKETGRASKEPEKHKDPNFADVDFVEYHEDEVTWSIKLKIPAGHRSRERRSLRCQAGYMVCDDKLAASRVSGPFPKRC